MSDSNTTAVNFDEEKYRMFLCGIEGLGSVQTDRLLEFFGSAGAVFRADENELTDIPGLRKEVLARIVSARENYDIDEEEARLKAQGIRFASRVHPDFPERLRNIADPPNGIFYIGTLPKGKNPAVAIVGSRNCSPYGREISRRFARELASAGVDIISGMAAGVDGYSHRGAIEVGGRTYAILGNGVDICYPKTNNDIYKSIPERGAVISEYYPGTMPFPINFPRRNRLISALSDGILVTEAREKSGTWITVDMGLEQGKDIYAIPGRIGDAMSVGCNRLIRQGARLVTKTEDIIAELAPKYGFLVARKGCGDLCGDKKSSGLSKEQERVLDTLGTDSLSADEIARRTGLGGAEVLAALTMLEIRGCLRPDGGGCFVRVE